MDVGLPIDVDADRDVRMDPVLPEELEADAAHLARVVVHAAERKPDVPRDSRAKNCPRARGVARCSGGGMGGGGTS